MVINARELRQKYQLLGPKETCRRLTEALREGHLKPSDFSLRDMAEELVTDGREWVRTLDPRYGVSVLENTGAVDTTTFLNITGQLLINSVLDAYNNPAYSISALFPRVSTRLSGERIPGIGQIGDKAESVKEGMPFPHVGLGEDYIDTPVTDKKGLILPVTKEAIFFDRTGLLLERAQEVGDSLRLNEEKQCVDVLIGATNNYKWKGTSYNTYQASTPWANLLSGASYDLADWTDIDEAEQLFANMLDPNTSEPIAIMAPTLVATPARKHAVNRILNATEVRYTVSGAPVETLAGNPISGINGITNPWVYSRLQSQLSVSAANSKATWFLGDFAKAFAIMENWAVTVVQAPQNSEAEFNQDIVARFKASSRNVAIAKNPRFVVKVTGY
jgi:hypothetical protein